ncbi:unnamed protein product, partial [Amoebophrya sp. A25]
DHLRFHLPVRETLSQNLPANFFRNFENDPRDFPDEPRGIPATCPEPPPQMLIDAMDMMR